MLEVEPVARLQAVLGGFAGIQLDDVLRLGAVALRVGFGTHIAFDTGDAPRLICPDDVDTELHVFHPKTLLLGAVKLEEHTLVPRQINAVAETGLLRAWRPDNFQRVVRTAHTKPSCGCSVFGLIIYRIEQCRNRDGNYQAEPNNKFTGRYPATHRLDLFGVFGSRYVRDIR